MHSHTYRALRGIEVTDDNLGFDAICRSGAWARGIFWAVEHTFSAMERDYFYPELADRQEPRTWQEDGAKDAWSSARDHAKEVLSSHHPQYLTAQQDAEIRKRFRILI